MERVLICPTMLLLLLRGRARLLALPCSTPPRFTRCPGAVLAFALLATMRSASSVMTMPA